MGDPPYALTPAQWAGAVEDETMFNKKQLLPKDLAARAEKVDPAKVEAEVLRIISKPAPRSVPVWPGQMLQAADLGLQQAMLQQANLQQHRRELERQARELERLYMSDPLPPLWGGFTG